MKKLSTLRKLLSTLSIPKDLILFIILELFLILFLHNFNIISDLIFPNIFIRMPLYYLETEGYKVFELDSLLFVDSPEPSVRINPIIKIEPTIKIEEPDTIFQGLPTTPLNLEKFYGLFPDQVTFQTAYNKNIVLDKRPWGWGGNLPMGVQISTILVDASFNPTFNPDIQCEKLAYNIGSALEHTASWKSTYLNKCIVHDGHKSIIKAFMLEHGSPKFKSMFSKEDIKWGEIRANKELINTLKQGRN